MNNNSRLYKYGTSENGMGTLARQPNPVDFMIDRQYIVIGTCQADLGGELGIYRVRTFYPFPIPDLREAYNQPVYNGHVTEYTVSETGDKNEKTEYRYNIPQYLSFDFFFRKRSELVLSSSQ